MSLFSFGLVRPVEGWLLLIAEFHALKSSSSLHLFVFIPSSVGAFSFIGLCCHPGATAHTDKDKLDLIFFTPIKNDSGINASVSLCLSSGSDWSSSFFMFYCSPPAFPRQLTSRRWPPPCLLRGCWPWRLLWSYRPLSPQKPRYLSTWTHKVAWWRSRRTSSTVCHTHTHIYSNTFFCTKCFYRKVRKQLIALPSTLHTAEKGKRRDCPCSPLSALCLW